MRSNGLNFKGGMPLAIFLPKSNAPSKMCCVLLACLLAATATRRAAIVVLLLRLQSLARASNEMFWSMVPLLEWALVYCCDMRVGLLVDQLAISS